MEPEVSEADTNLSPAEQATSTMIVEMAGRSQKMLDHLRNNALRPDTQKRLDVRIGIEEAAKLLGCSTARIRDAETDGRLPPAEVGGNNKRLGYTVMDLWNMREALNLYPERPADAPPAILAVQNFKGGVGKSTITVHLAHYFGLKGYRVLVIDCDSQATTTTCFGLDPHLFVQQEETLYPFLAIDRTQTTLDYAVQGTSWPNIDLIPSMQSLYDAEYELAATTASGGSILAERLSQLKRGVEDIAQHYDIVLLDPPPALGTLSLAIMRSANSMLIPLAATMPDFASTSKFLDMLGAINEDLASAGVGMEMNFLSVICSKFNSNDKSQEGMLTKVLRSSFGSSLVKTPVLESAEISHAFSRWKSVYELNKPIGATRTYKRCKENLDEAFAEVEQRLIENWNNIPLEQIVRPALA